MSSPERCPSCSSEHLADLGALPEMKDYLFAGGAKVRLEPSHLLRCTDCSLHFRYPAPRGEQLTEWYRQVPETTWEYEVRHEWGIVADWLNAHAPNRRVLEVGCFRGDFLYWLGEGWERAGIEPSEAAQKVARDRGIKIIAPTLEEIDPRNGAYGAVILLDVLEHFENPLFVLERTRDLLVAGGIAIILTGTTDAWGWKLSGAQYWYCGFPEHLSFINDRWLEWACQKLGLSTLASVRVSHAGGGSTSRTAEVVRLLAHSTVRGLQNLGVSEPRLNRVPFFWRLNRYCHGNILRDHILVALKKG